MNAATRVVSDTRKFDRGLKAILHDELHWLDVPERSEYKLGVMVYRCLHGQALWYLADHLFPASDAAPRHGRLRSANRNCLTVPRCRLSTYGCRAFDYAGQPSGTRCLMNLEILTVLIVLKGSWKQFTLATTSVSSALEVIFIMRCAT